MKTKYLIILICITSLLYIIGCSHKPEDNVNSFFEDLGKKNYSNLIDYVYQYDTIVEPDKAKFSELFSSLYEPSSDYHYNIKIISENDSSKTKEIEVTLTYANDSIEKIPFVIKQDKFGKWGIGLDWRDDINPLINALFYAGTSVLADKGVPTSVYEMALLFNEGKYVEQNNVKYIELLKEASKNYPLAQYILACEMKNGEIMSQDLNKARSLYEKAVDKGESQAYPDLAIMYINGWGGDVDYDKGVEILQKGIKKGIVSCYSLMGQVYENGLGVARDYDMSFKYYSEGLDKGEYHNCIGLGRAYLNGYGTEKDYKKAFEYFSKAFENNIDDAVVPLARCYYYGYGVSKNRNKAKKLLSDYKDNNDAQELLTEIKLAEISESLDRSLYENNQYSQVQKRKPKRTMCIWCMGKGYYDYVDFTVDGHRRRNTGRCTHCFGYGYIEE